MNERKINEEFFTQLNKVCVRPALDRKKCIRLYLFIFLMLSLYLENSYSAFKVVLFDNFLIWIVFLHRDWYMDVCVIRLFWIKCLPDDSRWRKISSHVLDTLVSDLNFIIQFSGRSTRKKNQFSSSSYFDYILVVENSIHSLRDCFECELTHNWNFLVVTNVLKKSQNVL